MERRLTSQDVAVFKQEYLYHKIICIAYEGYEFVFRSLGREEYGQIVSIVQDEKDLEDVIAQTALLYPEDYVMSDGPLSGLPPYIAPIIIEASDVSDIDVLMDMLHKSQQAMSRFDFQCISIIKAAMPEFNIEEIQAWTWEKIMFYTALGQKILNMTLPDGQVIDIIDNREQTKTVIEERMSEHDDPEFIANLRKQGIDPMFYFNVDGAVKRDLLDTPLLGGRHWQNEGVMNAIKQTILERRHRRDQARR